MLTREYPLNSKTPPGLPLTGVEVSANELSVEGDHHSGKMDWRYLPP